MEVKDKILKIARQEFAKNGYRNVRTDELAAKIGISKRTLYENFQSKELLFEEVIDVELLILKEKIDAIISNIETNQEVSLIDQMRNLWQIDADSSLSFTSQFFADIEKFTPHLWDKISEFRAMEMKQNFHRIFSIGVKQNMFKANLNIDILFMMHIATVQALLNPEDEVFSTRNCVHHL